MATKSLGPATPIQIMRKVLFALYTFFASRVARKRADSEGGERAESLEPQGIAAIHAFPQDRHF